MHITVLYNKFAMPNRGGACTSLLALMNGVAKRRDITADVYQTPPADPPKTEFEYEIHLKEVINIPKLTWANQVFERSQWAGYIENTLSSETDLVITQTILAPISVKIAYENEIPSLFLVRSMPLTGYEKYNPRLGHLSNLLKTDLGGMVQYPFLYKNFHDYRIAASKATHTIANSKFTAMKLKELFDVDSEVVYPPIELNNYRTQRNENGYITMVNPRTEYKGGDIFLDIAEIMKNEDFLLVGPIKSKKIKNRAEILNNVTHWEWCDNMIEAYSESKAVVTPSRWEEPFGRVPAEAMVSGIPCIVSNRGGLPEVVGDTGEIVENIESTEAWVEAIQKAIENHEPQEQKKHVSKFSAERQSEKFDRLIGQATDSTI